ncbi:MAG: type III pantothenate kinase [Bacteroidales bacterium]|jgi:type III pantothenate kinase|nr:type III pantothenate kinase [Bacteroidales bacterium]
MNLVIDEGNTVSKIALFAGEDLFSCVETTHDGMLHQLQALISEHPVEKAIYSTVSDNRSIDSFLRKNIHHVIILDETTALPVRILYKTPKTLGYDRVAGIVGANYLRPKQNILVIDAGTAITYDLVDAGGNFRGGNISLGLQMRFKALHHFTAKLPLLQPDGSFADLGDSTETAIRSGVINGLLYEIDGYINELKKKYDSLFVFLTGGDTFFLLERLKNSIFADTKLLIKGLNRILNYNAEL